MCAEKHGVRLRTMGQGVHRSAPKALSLAISPPGAITARPGVGVGRRWGQSMPLRVFGAPGANESPMFTRWTEIQDSLILSHLPSRNAKISVITGFRSGLCCDFANSFASSTVSNPYCESPFVSTTRPPFRPSSSGKRPDPSPGSIASLSRHHGLILCQESRFLCLTTIVKMSISASMNHIEQLQTMNSVELLATLYS